MLSDAEGLEAPPLPPKEGGWHPRVVVWWQRVWSSPMARAYIGTDLDGLERLADLHHELHSARSVTAITALSAEIRLQEERFGLSQLSRLRLNWTLPPADEGERAPKPPDKRPDRIADPRVVYMRPAAPQE